jgi:hypothetical protein
MVFAHGACHTAVKELMDQVEAASSDPSVGVSNGGGQEDVGGGPTSRSLPINIVFIFEGLRMPLCVCSRLCLQFRQLQLA